MRTCPSCGTAAEQHDVFCRRCGAALPPDAAGATPPSGGPPPPPAGGAGSAPPPPPPPMGPGGHPGQPWFGQPAGPGPGWYPPNGLLPGALASWSTRAGGLLIDTALVLAAVVPLYLLGLEAAFFTDLGAIAAVAGGVFLAVQVGQTGQSPGMRVVGVKCLALATGQPIGPGLGIVRSLAHFIDSLICYVGWLFPLWDARRQTIADKVVSTVVVSVPKQGLTLTPPPG